MMRKTWTYCNIHILWYMAGQIPSYICFLISHGLVAGKSPQQFLLVGFQGIPSS